MALHDTSKSPEISNLQMYFWELIDSKGSVLKKIKKLKETPAHQRRNSSNHVH
jgi:hypothetical protein